MEYLVTEAFSKAKKEKRKTVYYKDLGMISKDMCMCIRMANAFLYIQPAQSRNLTSLNSWKMLFLPP